MSAELGPDMASLASCATCGGSVDANAAAMSPGATSAYVYARGRIEPRFPNLAAEKEFVQATGRADTVGQTDQQAFQAVLAKRENRYLARQMCWVLTIQGLDAYVLVPRDSLDLALLVDAIRSAPGPGDIDVVIGTRGPITTSMSPGPGAERIASTSSARSNESRGTST